MLLLWQRSWFRGSAGTPEENLPSGYSAFFRGLGGSFGRGRNADQCRAHPLAHLREVDERRGTNPIQVKAAVFDRSVGTSIAVFDADHEKFYFDHHESCSIHEDGERTELRDIAQAEHEACLSLGEAAREFLARRRKGRLSVRVRNGGSIFETIVLIDSKSLP